MALAPPVQVPGAVELQSTVLQSAGNGYPGALSRTGQARGVPLSAGVSAGLCHLGPGTFCPSSPHPLTYSLLGTGGQSSGEVQRPAGRAEFGGAREAPDVTKPVEPRLLVSQTRRARC